MQLSAKGLQKQFPRAGIVVAPVDLVLHAGELTEITGRSGSGKSTLLNMLAGMLRPTSGSVFLDETDLYALAEPDLARLRNQTIGLIPQGHTALRSLTVLENVCLPAILYQKDPPPLERGRALLEQVGIAALSDAKPQELSGGEMRRMAIARAMLMQPKVLLADEPTAGLDNENAMAVLQLLRSCADSGTAVLLVTHEPEAQTFADCVWVMDGGHLSAASDPDNKGQ